MIAIHGKEMTMLLSPSLPTSLQGIRQLPVVRSDYSEIGCVFTFSPRSCSSEYNSCYWSQTARLIFFFLILVVSLILSVFFLLCVSHLCKWLFQHSFYLSRMFSIIHSSSPHICCYRALSFPWECICHSKKCSGNSHTFFLS